MEKAKTFPPYAKAKIKFATAYLKEANSLFHQLLKKKIKLLKKHFLFFFNHFWCKE